MASIEYKRREKPPVVILTDDAGQTQQVLLSDFEGNEAAYTEPFFGPSKEPVKTPEQQQIDALIAANEKLVAQRKSQGDLPPDYEAAAEAALADVLSP